MPTIAKPAIMWTCEKCGKVNYGDDTLVLEKRILQDGYYKYQIKREDHILCQYCNHDNHVIEE